QVANTSTRHFLTAPKSQAETAAMVKERAGVRETQTRLKDLGYDVGPADGVMGPQTAAELKRFQADRGMTPDGIINSELLARLRAQETPVRAQETPSIISLPDRQMSH